MKLPTNKKLRDLRAHTATPATGYEDINMQDFLKSNIYQYLFADFVRFLMMRWVIPNILGCVFCWKKLIFPLLNEIQITLLKWQFTLRG